MPRRLTERGELGDHLSINEHISGLPGVANPHRHDDDQSSGLIIEFYHNASYDRGDDFESQNKILHIDSMEVL